MQDRRRKLPVFLVALGLSGFVSMGGMAPAVAAEGVSAPEGAAETEKLKTVVSDASRTAVPSQIGVPMSWKQSKDLNDEASIQMQAASGMAYFLVISEPKDNFDQGTTLEDYAETVFSALRDNLENNKVRSGPKSITINGYPALQFEMQAKINKILSVVYLYTVIEGREGFHQAMGWSNMRKWDENKAILEAITNTFKEGLVKGEKI